ncbi:MULTISPECIES: ATP-binding protein [Kordiimonas]|uniref:ATP-binding protein n=1 Tax=Kordiimonas TaxID=288021 RepID=UPI00257D79ED|nr:ATP-binding protein [Kordiimonas sp. UBA4487]
MSSLVPALYAHHRSTEGTACAVGGGYKEERMAKKQQQILAFVDSHPKSYKVVAAAREKATKTGARWRLIYVDRIDESVGSDNRREALLSLLNKARREGASVLHLDSASGSQTELSYIRSCVNSGEAVSHIFMGQPATARGADLRRYWRTRRITKEFSHLASVTIIPLEGSIKPASLWSRFVHGPITWHTAVYPLVAVVAAYLAAEGIRALMPVIYFKINTHNVALLFLLACVMVAIRQGLLAAILASILSAATINYAYTVPFQKFYIGTVADVANITIFLASAVIIAFLGGHVRASLETTRRREERSRVLYEIHTLTAEASAREALLKVVARELKSLLGMKVVFFITKVRTSVLEADAIADFVQYPEKVDLDGPVKQGLEECWQAGDVGRAFRAVRHETSTWVFEPITTPNQKYGVLAVCIPLSWRLDSEFTQLISALADHTAQALERIEYATEMQESRFREEREKLRSMLLSSVSHDLKTPLASIIGSISVLKSLKKSDRLSDDQLETLAGTALEEAQRLDAFITNILSMTRIESGDVEFSCLLHDPAEPLDQALKSLRSRLQGRELRITRNYEGLHVEMDALMTAQVLQNVIDNAAKYSPNDSAIEIDLKRREDGFEYRVRDFGSGIPEDKQEKIFDKYERLNRTDQQVAGTGLGLAIAKVVMHRQGGVITAGNHKQGGAEFVLVFPTVVAVPKGQMDG